MILKEIWTPLIGFYYPYAISTRGNVKKLSYTKVNKTGTVVTKEISISLNKMKNRYFTVTLRCANGKYRKFFVHSLVAKYFIENPDNRTFINYIDGNTFNNNVQNLEYGVSSRVHNANKARALKRKPCYKFDLDGHMIKQYISVNEAAEDINCSIYSVRYACNKHTKLKGFYWAYSPIKLKMPNNE